MFLPLLLTGGAFWLVAYLLIVRRNARDQTYGMPLFGLVANASWELAFLGGYPHGLQGMIIGAFLLDLVMLGQTLRYGPREFPDLPRPLFHAVIIAAFAVAIPVVLTVNATFGDRYGAHSNFLAALMMSALFPAMLYARRSARGQSMPIAVTKLLGSAFFVLAFCTDRPPALEATPLLYTLFIAVIALDAVYVAALYRVTRRPTAMTDTEEPEQVMRVEGVV